MNEPRKVQLLEDATKAAILIVAMLVGYFIGKSTASSKVYSAGYLPEQEIARSPVSLVGKKIRLTGVDWRDNRRTLVLALQTTCHFCRESAPFYQRLVGERSHFSNVRLVAALPQAVKQSRDYLDGLGIAVDDVLQVSLPDIGVQGTPSLLLVDSEGLVSQAWTGKLQALGESDVFRALRSK